MSICTMQLLMSTFLTLGCNNCVHISKNIKRFCSAKHLSNIHIERYLTKHPRVGTFGDNFFSFFIQRFGTTDGDNDLFSGIEKDLSIKYSHSFNIRNIFKADIDVCQVWHQFKYGLRKIKLLCSIERAACQERVPTDPDSIIPYCHVPQKTIALMLMA